MQINANVTTTRHILENRPWKLENWEEKPKDHIHSVTSVAISFHVGARTSRSSVVLFLKKVIYNREFGGIKKRGT